MKTITRLPLNSGIIWIALKITSEEVIAKSEALPSFFNSTKISSYSCESDFLPPGLSL